MWAPWHDNAVPRADYAPDPVDTADTAPDPSDSAPPDTAADTADSANDTADSAPVDPIDADGDRYDADRDCDDADPAVHPGADDPCGGPDADCDPTFCIPEGLRLDFASSDWDAYCGFPGRSLATLAWDVDGDGADDLVVSDASANQYFYNYFVTPVSDGVWTIPAGSAGDQSASAVSSFHLDEGGELTGLTLARIPDVDGDGVDELLASDPGYYPYYSGSRLVVVSGATLATGGAVSDATWTLTSAAYSAITSFAADDLDGDGEPDVLLDDIYTWSALPLADIAAGVDLDTLDRNIGAPLGLAVDLDGDGAADLPFIDVGGVVTLGTPALGLDDWATLPDTYEYGALALDLDGDGLPSLMVWDGTDITGWDVSGQSGVIAAPVVTVTPDGDELDGFFAAGDGLGVQAVRDDHEVAFWFSPEALTGTVVPADAAGCVWGDVDFAIDGWFGHGLAFGGPIEPDGEPTRWRLLDPELAPEGEGCTP